METCTDVPNTRVNLPDPRVEIVGASWLEATDHGLLPHRLPAWTRPHFPDAFYHLNEIQPSGVRLRFTTAARTITLVVAVSRSVGLEARAGAAEPVVAWEGAPERFDLLCEGQLVATAQAGEAGRMLLDFAAGVVTDQPGSATPVTFEVSGSGGAARTYELWLPYREHVRLVALEADAEIVAPEPSAKPRWLHHGSSISHGANAASPSGIWPVIAAQAAGVEVTNLGFSGAAVLDPFVARAMRDAEADVLSVKIGINVLNGDFYGRRMFRPLLHGFLDTVREGKPTTPVMVISPVFCPIGENVPGPTMVDPTVPVTVFRTYGSPDQVAAGKLHLREMREIIASVVADRVAAGDGALHYLDGLELYGPGDWATYPMADLLHPDPPAQRLIGERFAPVLRALLP